MVVNNSPWCVGGGGLLRDHDGQKTLPETNSKFAPENRPKRPKRKRSYSNHPFSGVFAVSSPWWLGFQSWSLSPRFRSGCDRNRRDAMGRCPLFEAARLRCGAVVQIMCQVWTAHLTDVDFIIFYWSCWWFSFPAVTSWGWYLIPLLTWFLAPSQVVNSPEFSTINSFNSQKTRGFSCRSPRWKSWLDHPFKVVTGEAKAEMDQTDQHGRPECTVKGGSCGLVLIGRSSIVVGPQKVPENKEEVVENWREQVRLVNHSSPRLLLV